MKFYALCTAMHKYLLFHVVKVSYFKPKLLHTIELISGLSTATVRNRIANLSKLEVRVQANKDSIFSRKNAANASSKVGQQIKLRQVNV